DGGGVVDVQHAKQEFLAGLLVGRRHPAADGEENLFRLNAKAGAVLERIPRVHVQGGRGWVGVEPAVDLQARDLRREWLQRLGDGSLGVCGTHATPPASFTGPR